MSQIEFEQWAALFERCPFDDFHLHTLPAAIQICATNGANINDVLNILQSRNYTEDTQESKEQAFDVDMSVFAAFGIAPPPSYKGKRT